MSGVLLQVISCYSEIWCFWCRPDSAKPCTCFSQHAESDEDELLLHDQPPTSPGKLVKLPLLLLRFPRALLEGVARLPAYLARLALVLARLELLAEDGEVGLVGGQTQHDEVRVCPVQAVVRVRVVIGLAALAADVVHDLVLPLARHVGVR